MARKETRQLLLGKPCFPFLNCSHLNYKTKGLLLETNGLIQKGPLQQDFSSSPHIPQRPDVTTVSTLFSPYGDAHFSHTVMFPCPGYILQLAVPPGFIGSAFSFLVVCKIWCLSQFNLESSKPGNLLFPSSVCSFTYRQIEILRGFVSSLWDLCTHTSDFTLS